MLTVTCINKVRDNNGKIVSYILQDSDGNKRPVEPLQLKDAIFRGAIIIDNLKLTSDGRLIDAKSQETNTENDIVGMEDWKAAKKLAAETTRKLNSLLMLGWDVVNYENKKFLLDNKEEVSLPSINITFDKDGVIDKDSNLSITTNSIRQEMLELVNKHNLNYIQLAIGISAQSKKYIKDKEFLCDYTVYVGWTSPDSNICISGTELKILEKLYNATLDLVENACYNDSFNNNTGENCEKEDKELIDIYTDSAATMLYYDIVKTLGLTDKVRGLQGMLVKIVPGIFDTTIKKIMKNKNFKEHDSVNSIAEEHFNKFRQSTFDALDANVNSDIDNIVTNVVNEFANKITHNKQKVDSKTYRDLKEQHKSSTANNKTGILNMFKR